MKVKTVERFFGYLLICALSLLGGQAQGAPNSWTPYETDIENYAMGWTNAHWVPVLGKMLLFGGNSHNPVGNNSVRLFDPVSDKWEVLYANNNGTAGVHNRDNQVSFYVPGRGENGEFWVLRGAVLQFGGIFSLDSNQWTTIADSATQFGQGLIKGIENYYYTETASSDWCPELNMGVMFGGRNTAMTRFIEPNDSGGPEPYKYWHKEYDDGPGRLRQNQNSGVCVGKEFYLYGGETLTGNGVVRPRALWKLDLTTKTWIRLSDNNLPDGQRVDGGYLVVTYDSRSNVLVVNRGQKFNIYHLDSDTWEYIDAPVDSNVSWRGSNHAGVYSPLVNQHIYRWSYPGRTDGYTYADGGPVRPIVSLSADSLVVESGDMATLTWSASNAASCTASGEWSGDKGTSGNETVGPLTVASTFVLTCTGDGGNTVRSVSVSISDGGGSGGGEVKDIPPSGLVSGLSVNDAGNGSDWLLQGDFQSGVAMYGDRSYTATTVPAEIAGGDWVRPANDSKSYTGDVLATFTVTEDVDVYIAHRDNISVRPDWLSTWVDTGQDLENSEPNTYSLYKKAYSADSTVTLGPNGSTQSGMYIVLVKAGTGNGGGSGSVDTDNDGIEDSWEQTNFGDLVTANGSSDYDSDGLLDKDEQTQGTDPRNSDTDGDGDLDGDEVRYGSDPGNSNDTVANYRPDTPVLGGIGSGISLKGGFNEVAFNDVDGNGQAASEWQISTDASFENSTLVLSRQRSGDVLEQNLTLPLGVLEADGNYWIRVRHQDSTGLWSLWSAAMSFTTVLNDANDADGNGTDDRYQVAEVEGVDTDGNGVTDLQEGMCNLRDAEGNRAIGFRVDQGVVGCLSALPVTELSGINLPGDMPYGLFSIRIEGLQAGETVTLSLYFPEDLDATAQWYKYDEVSGVLNDLSGVVSNSGSRADIQLIDGGEYDADGIANGVIVDPIGPVIVTTDNGDDESSTGNVSSGGGGSTSPLGIIMLVILGVITMFRKYPLQTGRLFAGFLCLALYPIFAGATSDLGIPINTWVVKPMPAYGDGPSGDIKHMRLTHNPVNGKIYFLGGDYAGPDGSQSGRNELYSYSVVDDSWVEEHPYCGDAGSVQPDHPDEMGWVYDTKRDIFWMIPGYMGGTASGECAVTYVKDEIMTFDPATRKWANPEVPLLSGLGGEANKFAQYDPEEDAIINFYWDGGHGAAAAIYHIDSKTWERVKFPKPNDNARISKEYTAMDLENRTIYTMDPKAGRFYSYDMDARTLKLLGDTPVKRDNYGITWIAWDSVNKVVLWYFGGKVLVYHPDTNTWEDPMPILPDVPVRGNNAVFDPDQNVLLVMGGLYPSNPYMFLYRYGNANIAIPSVPTGLNIKLP